MIRVDVDSSRCSGHARCYDAAPDLFPVDDAGYVEFKTREFDDDASDAIDAAVSACPERALTVTRLAEAGNSHD